MLWKNMGEKRMTMSDGAAIFGTLCCAAVSVVIVAYATCRGIFGNKMASEVSVLFDMSFSKKGGRKSSDDVDSKSESAATTRRALPYNINVFFFVPKSLSGRFSLLPVTRIRVLKMYPSKTKPLLVEFSCFGFFPQRYIYKKEDVSADFVVQEVFHYLNRTWRRANRGNWFVATYRVFRLNERSGLIQFVDASNSANICEKDMARERFIPSLVGGIIGTYALGVRDQHYENILLRRSDGAVLHIDFGYILQSKSLMLGTRIAIPPICFRDAVRKKTIIEESWKAYETAFVEEDGAARFKQFVESTIRSLDTFDSASSAASIHSTDNTREGAKGATQFSLFNRRRSSTDDRDVSNKRDCLETLAQRANRYFSETGCVDHSTKSSFTKRVRVFQKMKAKNFIHKLIHGVGS